MCPDMAWFQSCEIPHTLIIHCLFASYLIGKPPWLNICHIFFPDNPNLVSYVPVTVQVLDVNDNAPYIATDSALVVCEGSKAGQVSYLLSVLFSVCPYHSFSTCQLQSEPWNCFSYLHSSFSPVLFSYPILHHFCFLKPYFFSWFNSIFLFTHMYEHTHSHVH